MEAWVDAFIHFGDHVRDCDQAFVDRPQNLALALLAMAHQAARIAPRLLHRLAMRRIVERFFPIDELGEAFHIGLHVAVRRGDDGGRPAHDMIAGEDRVRLMQRKAEMIGGMTRRGNGFERPAVLRDDFAIAEYAVRRVAAVKSGIGARATIFNREKGAADNFRAGCFFERGGSRAVIAMGMGADDVADRFALGRSEDRFDMARVFGARIDDRDIAVTDNIGLGASIGEGRRIGRKDAAHLGVQLHRQAGWQVFRQVHLPHVASCDASEKGKARKKGQDWRPTPFPPEPRRRGPRRVSACLFAEPGNTGIEPCEDHRADIFRDIAICGHFAAGFAHAVQSFGAGLLTHPLAADHDADPFATSGRIDALIGMNRLAARMALLERFDIGDHRHEFFAIRDHRAQLGFVRDHFPQFLFARYHRAQFRLAGDHGGEFRFTRDHGGDFLFAGNHGLNLLSCWMLAIMPIGVNPTVRPFIITFANNYPVVRLMPFTVMRGCTLFFGRLHQCVTHCRRHRQCDEQSGTDRDPPSGDTQPGFVIHSHCF